MEKNHGAGARRTRQALTKMTWVNKTRKKCQPCVFTRLTSVRRVYTKRFCQSYDNYSRRVSRHLGKRARRICHFWQTSDHKHVLAKLMRHMLHQTLWRGPPPRATEPFSDRSRFIYGSFPVDLQFHGWFIYETFSVNVYRVSARFGSVKNGPKGTSRKLKTGAQKWSHGKVKTGAHFCNLRFTSLAGFNDLSLVLWLVKISLQGCH